MLADRPALTPRGGRDAGNRDHPKATGRKRTAKPKATETKAAPKFEPKVGDPKLLAEAVEAGTAAKVALGKRDEAIRAAVKGGTSARQVALSVGLTHGAVLKLVR